MLKNHVGKTVDESPSVDCEIRRIDRYTCKGISSCDDEVIQEVMLAIELDGYEHYQTTCSPWQLDELIFGHLFLEGIIGDARHVSTYRLQKGKGRYQACVGLQHEPAGAFNCSESIGIFPLPGKNRSQRSSITLRFDEVPSMISYLENNSRLFRRTGGVHNAVLIGKEGTLGWFEDIGRHSTVEKLAGWCLLNSIDPSDSIMLFSGRMPYEIVNKVVKMGIPLIVSPGAPTILSITVAQEHDIALIGFAKHDRYNIYSKSSRVTFI